MNLLVKILLLASLFYSISISENVQKHNRLSYIDTANKQAISPCRPDVEKARKVVENFLTNTDLSDERIETGTTGLEVSQIQVLDDSQDSNACQEFDQRYQQAINKEGANNDNFYDVAYYKAGNFYFVVLVLAPPSDPDSISMGLSHIVIFDDNLDKLAAYSG